MYILDSNYTFTNYTFVQPIHICIFMPPYMYIRTSIYAFSLY